MPFHTNTFISSQEATKVNRKTKQKPETLNKISLFCQVHKFRKGWLSPNSGWVCEQTSSLWNMPLFNLLHFLIASVCGRGTCVQGKEQPAHSDGTQVTRLTGLNLQSHLISPSMSVSQTNLKLLFIMAFLVDIIIENQMSYPNIPTHTLYLLNSYLNPRTCHCQTMPRPLEMATACSSDS